MAFGFDDGKQVSGGAVDLGVVDRGSGHPVVMVHGFPELAYSWRHQVPALADAGYRAIAYDQRGFGTSTKPEVVSDYALADLVNDFVTLLDVLEIDRATIVGHDWGSIVAWTAALVHPERVHSVVSLNVPYRGRCSSFPPISVIEDRLSERFGYVLFFQEPGKPEQWFAADPDGVLRRFYFGAAADTGFLPDPDLQVYLDAFTTGGLTGGFNLYRNIDRNWDEFAHLADAVVQPPALMVAADRDPVLPMALVDGMEAWFRDLQVEVVPDCGHWTQQEQPDVVNGVLLGFLERVTGVTSHSE